MSRLFEGQALNAAAIKAFASRFDPQPFHLDETEAATSPFGGLVASGWQSVALTLSMLEQRIGDPLRIVSVDSVRWLRPVGAGSRIGLSDFSREMVVDQSDKAIQKVQVSMTADDVPAMAMRCTIIVADPPPLVSLPTPAPWAGGETSLAAPFDDIMLGHSCVIGIHELSLQETDWFRAAYGSQGCDATAAPRWQVASYWMASYVRARAKATEGRRARGLPLPVGGPSPGFGKMLWARDIKVGETLTYGMEITAKRRQPRSDWAVLTSRGGALDASGLPVMTYEGRILWPAA